MKVLRLVILLLVAVIGLVAMVAFGARFLDGPIGPFPGGALRSGVMVDEALDDWSFATDEEEIEFQLTSQDRSRITWVLVDEGTAFIPCSSDFPPGKTWHHHALKDGRALLRIQGRRYPVTLERVQEQALIERLLDLGKAKYSGGSPGDGEVWFFRVATRQ